MSAPVGPGDLVEFYRLWRGVPLPAGFPLALGGIYTVREVTECISWPGGEIEPALKLCEHMLWGPDRVECAIPLCCFRPVRRPSIEILKSALQSAPDRELEDA